MTDSDYKRRYRNGPRLKKIVARWKKLPLKKLDEKTKVTILLFGTDAAGMDRAFVKEKCALDASVPELPDDSVNADAGEE